MDLNDGAKKRDKLSHEVDGAFEIKAVNKNNTIAIQRGDVVETVTANRVTRAPKAAKTKEPEHASTPADLAKKNTKGKKWYFKKILDHREMDDGSLEFKLEWEGNWRPSWQPRENVPEEAVSRYLAKVARRNRRAGRAQSSA